MDPLAKNLITLSILFCVLHIVTGRCIAVGLKHTKIEDFVKNLTDWVKTRFDYDLYQYRIGMEDYVNHYQGYPDDTELDNTFMALCIALTGG
ncbi:hypothetical protein TELCIR_14495, partial [Teladorsagia circumcincta]